MRISCSIGPRLLQYPLWCRCMNAPVTTIHSCCILLLFFVLSCSNYLSRKGAWKGGKHSRQKTTEYEDHLVNSCHFTGTCRILQANHHAINVSRIPEKEHGFICFFLRTPKSIVSPLLCQIFFWCVRIAFLA